MKSLKFYFVASLIWALAGMFLISCSDKKSGGGTHCATGVIVNGVCQDNNGGWNSPYNFRIGYGQITNSSTFRKFVSRFNGIRYYYYAGYGNNQIRVRILNPGSNNPTIEISSPEIATGVITVQGQKFDDGTRKFYEIYHLNPYQYKIGEMKFTSGQFDKGSFELVFYGNASEKGSFARGTIY